MTLTIGRFTTQRDPAQFHYNGDSLSFGGLLFATSLDDLEVQRQQLLGLDGNADEPDVPVTWSRDVRVDGFYTVKSVTVTPIRGVTYNQFKFGFDVELERVQGGFAAPLCEVATSIALRTNAHAISSSTGLVGVPAAATAKRGVYATGQLIMQRTDGPRTSATGDVHSFDASVTASTFGSYSFNLGPSDYYDGAALIEQSVGGVWYSVVGDQIGSIVGNLLRVGNGLVRMTYHTDGIISTELWDGSVWESTTSFELVGGTAGKWLPSGGWRVLKNSTDACTVQTAILPTSGSIFSRTVTLHIERFRMLVEIAADGLFFATTSGDFAESLELQATVPVTASSTPVGGIMRSANDANGHRWLMFSPSAVTEDLVNGSMTIAAPAVSLVAQFGLGWERDGSTGAAVYDQATVGSEYFAALGTRQRVVAR